MWLMLSAFPTLLSKGAMELTLGSRGELEFGRSDWALGVQCTVTSRNQVNK